MTCGVEDSIVLCRCRLLLYILDTVELALSGHSFLQWKMAVNHEWRLKPRLTLVTLVTNFVKNCSKIPEFGIKPNAFDCISIFLLSNVMKF